MHPWTAAMVVRNTVRRRDHPARAGPGYAFAPVRAGPGSYDDLLDIPRHLAALHRYDDIADIADQAVGYCPERSPAVAYLAEIRPLIPPAERAWILVAEHEVQALLSAGNLPAAPAS